MSVDQRRRLRQIADVTRSLDGCPMGAMPECGDLIEMGLVILHDHPEADMLWVEPSREGWAEAGRPTGEVSDE